MLNEAVLKLVLRCFKLIIEILYIPVHIIRMFKKPKKCPPITDKLLLISATEVAKLIRKKQITSQEITLAYIKRIKEVNPIINAVIENRFEEALQEATKIDAFLQNFNENEIERNTPLLGVPVTVKASIGVKNMNHGAGRVDYQVKAKTDAASVKKIRDAGAIILLISNVPELCLNWETTNKLIGRANNPYDTRRTPGGSSGGEASLLGSGASLVGLGSDIGGSLRFPAHCCGVWAHKPSPYVVSSVGHYPDCENKEEWNRTFTIGPMARYAPDLKLLLNIIAEDGIKTALQLDQPVDVTKIKVYYMDDPRSAITDRFNDTAVRSVEKVVDHFDGICTNQSKKVSLPLMKFCTELSFLSLLNVVRVGNVDSVLNNKKHGLYWEMLKFHLGQSDHQFSSVWIEVVRRLNVHMSKKMQNALKKLRSDFIDLLGEDGVFVIPTSPIEALFHGDIYRKVFNCGYMAIFNSLGLPVTNCPVMFSANGLPVGVQVVAAPNFDRLGLAVAEEIQRAFGGWKGF